MAFLEFVPKKFHDESLDMIIICNDILNEYETEGYDLTVRQLYYQLVSRDVIENSNKSYSRICGLVNDARLAGMMDWDRIVDRGRNTVRRRTFNSPHHAIERVSNGFSIDRWYFQPVRVEVMCEKQALEGVLSEECIKWGVPFTSNKGYPSQSLLYEKGRAFNEIMVNERQNIEIIYFGDHDPSGIDMDRDVEKRIRMFADADTVEDMHNKMISFRRVALTMDQIKKYKPPPNPAKISDSRAMSYIRRYGRSSWELDALSPRVLADLLSDEIEMIIRLSGSKRVWDATDVLEDEMRDELTCAVDSLKSQEWERKKDAIFEMAPPRY